MERKIFMKQWPFPNPIEPSTACWLIKPKTICIYKSTLLWDPLLQDTPSTAAPESTSPAETMATSPEDAEPRASSVPLFSDEAPPLPAPSETPEFEEMPVSKNDLDDILIAFKYLTEVPEVYKYLLESDDESVQEVEEESETWFYWIQFVTWVSFPILSSKKHDKTDFLILLPQSFISSLSLYIYTIQRSRKYLYRSLHI